MSRVIIDLAAKRQGASSSGPLEHPAGVTLPFDNPSDAALIIPEIRSEIHLEGNLDKTQRKRLIEIAALCPVHRTLSSEIKIRTEEI